MSQAALDILITLKVELERVNPPPLNVVHLAVAGAIAALRVSRPADLWEACYIVIGEQDNLTRMCNLAWEPYAAGYNADGKQVIWMKRRLP
jgi:hypothetical protein